MSFYPTRMTVGDLIDRLTEIGDRDMAVVDDGSLGSLVKVVVAKPEFAGKNDKEICWLEFSKD